MIYSIVNRILLILKLHYVRFLVMGLVLGFVTSIGVALGCAWLVDVDIPLKRVEINDKSVRVGETRGLMFQSSYIGHGTSWRSVLSEGSSPWGLEKSERSQQFHFLLMEYRWGWPTAALFHREIFIKRYFTNGRSHFMETANAIDLRKIPERREFTKPVSPRGDLIPVGILWVGILSGTAFWGLLWMCTIMGALWLKQTIQVYRGCCPKCGYCLEGLDAVGCPECGWGRGAGDE